MERREHWMAPTTGDAIPQQVVCVHVDAFDRSPDGVPGTRQQELRSWQVARWRYEAGKPCRYAEIAGETRDQFWSVMDRSMRSGCVTWAFSMDALRAMTLLGLFERLETGEVYLTGSDYRGRTDTNSALVSGLSAEDALVAGGHGQSPGPVVPELPERVGRAAEHFEGPHEKSRREPAGYAVLESPPTIVLFRRRGRAGAVRWVGTENYAQLTPSRLPDAPTPAGRLAAFVRNLIALVADNGLGALAATGASQAWNALRRRFLHHGVLVHSHGCALALERSAYLGGRNECYRLGPVPGPVYHLDVRSMYPYVYGAHYLPVQLVGYCHGGLTDEARRAVCAGRAVAEVVLYSTAASYPACRRTDARGQLLPLEEDEPLPGWRDKRALCFPTGTYRTALCGPELLDAYAHGRVLAWKRVSWYRMAPLLTAYAREIYAIREECRRKGDAALESAVKRWLVTLHGKFGQTSRRWVWDHGRVARTPYCSWWAVGVNGDLTRWRAIAWQTQREEHDGETWESCPAIAAWITALGRYHLLRFLRAAGREECYYTDTDSLLCSQTGYDRLRAAGLAAENEIGKMRVLGIHQQCEIRGIKHYVLDGITTCAGIPGGAPQVGPDQTAFWAREWAASALRQKCRPVVRERLTTVKRRAAYHHGRVGGDGRVYPLEMEEETSDARAGRG